MRHALHIALALPAVAILFASGCASESYFCDETGCYFCDGLGCRDVQAPERPACSGDPDCPDGTLCTDIGCVEGCRNDDDCPRGSECTDRMCLHPTEPPPLRTPGTCVVPEDCASTELTCRDGMCVPDDSSCNTEGCDCAGARTCGGSLVCSADECRVPADVCRFNHECGDRRICLDGRCSVRCLEDMDCPDGQSCESAICRDLPPPTGECRVDADCGDGRACREEVCEDSCTTDSNCAEGDYCREGVCELDDRPKPFCERNADCEAGHPCVGGICRTPCTTSDECLRFDVQFNVCQGGFCVTTNEVTSDCLTSEDCDGEKDCIDGICR